MSSTELLVVVVVVLVLFGSSAIPKFARSIGQAKSEFERGIKEGKDSGKDKDKDTPPQAGA
jgi:sec-independent protein translocase protein TatA